MKGIDTRKRNVGAAKQLVLRGLCASRAWEQCWMDCDGDGLLRALCAAVRTDGVLRAACVEQRRYMPPAILAACEAGPLPVLFEVTPDESA